ncbi:MAG: SLC13/DASS family transporter [Candidatus Zixiibacteriota bacterium]|nr:MAG: SLC13/DASS family transporter [candidate division Zixibacteria bacterium]
MPSALPASGEQPTPILERPRRLRSRRFSPGELRRAALLLLGLALFLAVYLAPPWADAVDPEGRHFALTREGKATLALFLLAGVWWVFEVVPIGVTGVAVGLIQVLFAIRSPQTALGSFFDPAIWFIFATLILGKSFSKTGLTQRVAYNILALAGDRTSMIYLGSFAMIAVLTLFMAHTAVAATIFPLLMAIHSLYQEDGQSTRFGKGLFIGMAFAAGGSSIVTYLSAARGIIAAGFFHGIAGREISFAEFSWYLLPVGWCMLVLLWLLVLVFFKPERKVIPSLKTRARDLASRLGPVKRSEKLVLILALGVVALLILRSAVPWLQPLDRTGLLLTTTLLLFVFKVLSLQDLEDIPWNILLLFGGTMSLGLCLWQTGAAQWLAVRSLPLFQHAPWFVFILCLGGLILVLTNLVVNVAVIAFVLPVGLLMAPYLGVTPEIVFFTTLVTAGMPFLLLVGAAPNAIAYESRQFTPAEFLKIGVPASLILLAVWSLFVLFLWPLMGLPVLSSP